LFEGEGFSELFVLRQRKGFAFLLFGSCNDEFNHGGKKPCLLTSSQASEVKVFSINFYFDFPPGKKAHFLRFCHDRINYLGAPLINTL
jgi:hypothetical protein